MSPVLKSYSKFTVLQHSPIRTFASPIVNFLQDILFKRLYLCISSFFIIVIIKITPYKMKFPFGSGIHHLPFHSKMIPRFSVALLNLWTDRNNTTRLYIQWNGNIKCGLFGNFLSGLQLFLCLSRSAFSCSLPGKYMPADFASAKSTAVQVSFCFFHSISSSFILLLRRLLYFSFPGYLCMS